MRNQFPSFLPKEKTCLAKLSSVFQYKKKKKKKQLHDMHTLSSLTALGIVLLQYII